MSWWLCNTSCVAVLCMQCNGDRDFTTHHRDVTPHVTQYEHNYYYYMYYMPAPL